MIVTIQILRGFAAYLVVFSHIPELLPGPLSYLRGGIGVDIFFVISGFIMFMLAVGQEQGVASAKRFFVIRLIRIFPIYIIINLIVYFSSYFIHDITPDPGHFAQSLILIPQTDEHGILVPPYIHAAWTLSFEMFFYIVVTLLILIKKFNVIS